MPQPLALYVRIVEPDEASNTIELCNLVFVDVALCAGIRDMSSVAGARVCNLDILLRFR